MVKTLALKSIHFANKISQRKGVEILVRRIPKDTDKYYENYSENSILNRRFYNICAGGHPELAIEHPFWTNMDLKGVSRINKKEIPEIVPYDLLNKEPLPIEDNSAEIILSQYSLEHVPDPTADFFLKESFRTLKSNGVLRIIVPNIDLAIQAYSDNDESYFWWFDKNYSIEQKFLLHFATNASTEHKADNPNKISDEEFQNMWRSLEVEEVLNFCTSQCKIDIQKQIRSDHINWWNSKKLIQALTKAGFRDARIASPYQSRAQVLRNHYYFEQKRNYVALTIEAIK